MEKFEKIKRDRKFRDKRLYVDFNVTKNSETSLLNNKNEQFSL